MLVRDLANHVIGLKTQCLWVTLTPIPGLHWSSGSISDQIFFFKPFFFLLDAEHGAGQYTEKRIHLSNRLPSWIKSLVPKIFYITEKAWNYYPFTITEYTCSFVPRFAIHIQTKYLNDRGTTDNVSTYLGNSLSMLSSFDENLVIFYAKKLALM